MKNLNKVSRIAYLAFRNGVRLHKDSILLFNNRSFPSALQLSILAQEEIGKAFLFEEHMLQNHGRTEDFTKEYEKIMTSALLSHQVKQGWFSRQADDFWKYHGKRYSKFITEVNNGKLEERKQNAVYVGLTKKGKDINLNGRIINPDRIKPDYVKSHLTRINDFIIILIEECRCQVSMVESENLDKYLTIDLAHKLEELWPFQSQSTKSRLIKVRKFALEVPTD